MSPFKIGDIVRLRCGGPQMVVHEELDKGECHTCVWTVDGLVQTDCFRPEALVLVERQAHDLQEGDVVKLRSSATRMTVESLLDDGKATCSWHNNDGRPEFATYSVHSLRVEQRRP